METPKHVAKPITEATRQEALRLLEKGQRGCWRRVEKLLGWPKSDTLREQEMAEQLGIERQRLIDLWVHYWKLVNARRSRAAKRAADAVALIPRISHAAACTLFVPEHWVITTDTFSQEPLAHELRNLIEQQGPAKIPGRWYLWTDDDVQFSKTFKGRLQAKEEYDQRVAKAKERERVERMETALFEVDAPDDSAHVEVSRLKLDSDLSAIELYQLSRDLPGEAGYSRRPNLLYS